MRSVKELIEDELHKIPQNLVEKGVMDSFVDVKDNFTPGQINILNNVFETVIKGVENWVETEFASALEDWLKNEFVPALFTREGRVVLIDNDKKENNEIIEKDKEDDDVD